MCVMEAVAYFAGEKHSHKPQCACPALTGYMMTLNDLLPKDERQLLKPYILKLIGTRDNNNKTLKRAEILSWTSITKLVPHCLNLISLNAEALKLQSLQPFDWKAATLVVRSAARSAYSMQGFAPNWAAAHSAEAAGKAAGKAAEAASHAASSAAYSADSTGYSAELVYSASLEASLAIDSTAHSANAASHAASSAAYSADSAGYSAELADFDKEAARINVVKLALETLDEALAV
jgi:hypothetical protein